MKGNGHANPNFHHHPTIDSRPQRSRRHRILGSAALGSLLGATERRARRGAAGTVVGLSCWAGSFLRAGLQTGPFWIGLIDRD
jgi:hypothetical protein